MAWQHESLGVSEPHLHPQPHFGLTPIPGHPPELDQGLQSLWRRREQRGGAAEGCHQTARGERIRQPCWYHHSAETPALPAVPAMGSLKPGCACSKATGAWCVPRKGPLEHGCPHDGAAGAKCVSGQGCSMCVCTHVHDTCPSPHPWGSSTPNLPVMGPDPPMSPQWSLSPGLRDGCGSNGE